jgi:hypothetical protein
MSYLQKKRKAFSMITAIFVILLLATVGGFIMNISGKVVQETISQYRKEQAILYAKSYTEFAIMAATSQDCVRRIQANVDGKTKQVLAGEGYRVDVRVQYIGDTSSTCTNTIGGINIMDSAAVDNIIIIDTYVHYREPDSIPAIRGLSWTQDPGITYHRRTLQRL